MALIKFKNLPDTSTPLNAENLNNNFEELENELNEKTSKEMLQCTIASNYTTETSSTYEPLPIIADIKFGNKLTVKDGEIIVGEDVSTVMITAKISYNSLTAGLKWLGVWVNDTNKVIAPMQLSARGLVYATPTLVNVKKDDKITLRLFGTVGDVVRALSEYTNIVVEVIE